MTGIWTGIWTEPNRDPQDFSFRFTQTGGTLSGKMYGDNESIPLKDAKIEGDRISFTVTTEMNGQINKFTFSGDVHDGGMELTRERESSSKNKKEDKLAPKQTLRLRRLA